jgi:hypothetical protein
MIADPPSGVRFDANSPNGVGKDAYKALHPLRSGTFTKVETGHAETFDLEPDEAGQRYLRNRLKARGTMLIVALPNDEHVSATCFGAGAEANRPV